MSMPVNEQTHRSITLVALFQKCQAFSGLHAEKARITPSIVLGKPTPRDTFQQPEAAAFVDVDGIDSTWTQQFTLLDIG